MHPENEKDKQRFEKMKDAEIKRGRDEDEAIEVAAQETKELRRQEGRSKGAEDVA